MTVTSPYLRGPVNDPHVAGGLVIDPRKSYLRGPVNDPHVAGGLVNDPRKSYPRGLVNDPHVAGGLVNDPRNITTTSNPQVSNQASPHVFSRDYLSFLKTSSLVYLLSLPLKSIRCGIG
jgi:hypothetical protein